MARKFEEPVARWPHDRRTRVAARTKAMLAEMPLSELRRARKVTREALATELGTEQPEVSRIERQADMYVSTLRRFIEAMGGKLEITAHFPDGDVRISQFHELDGTD